MTSRTKRYVMYGELAEWWPLLSPPEDYADSAAVFADLLDAACVGEARTLLELGSGGGNHASHLTGRYDLTLVDLSPDMLAMSRALNPTARHVVGDMRALRLPERFDAVLVHDAICYMTSEDDLRAALATAFAHLRPGGAALFAPDHVTDTFTERTDHDGRDAPDGRGLRYVEWVFDPDPSDTTYVAAYAFVLRDAAGETRALHDRHVVGLFPRETWLRLLAEVGFVDARAEPLNDRLELPWAYEVFVARRPGPR